MTWAEFNAAVRELLPSDDKRLGVQTFIDKLIRHAVINLQSYIDLYRKSQQNIYAPADFTTEGSASKGTLPADCAPRDVFVVKEKTRTVSAVDTTLDQLTVTAHGMSTVDPNCVGCSDNGNVNRGTISNSGGAVPGGVTANRNYFIRVVDANTVTLHTTAAGVVDNTNRVDITSAGTGTNTLHYLISRRTCDTVRWADRHELLSGQACLNDGNGKLAIAPNGIDFVVAPEIQALDVNGYAYSFELNWDGKKLVWADADATPFDDAAVMAAATYVRQHLAMEVDRDPALAGAYAGVYAGERANLYLDAQERARQSA